MFILFYPKTIEYIQDGCTFDGNWNLSLKKFKLFSAIGAKPSGIKIFVPIDHFKIIM